MVAKLIGQRVREERELKGMRRDQLAKAIGCDCSRIRHIEDGEGGLSNLVLQAIARVLGTPMDTFFGSALTTSPEPAFLQPVNFVECAPSEAALTTPA